MIRIVSGGSGPALAARARDDLVLASGRPDLDTLVVLDLTDEGGDLGATIEETDEILIELVDLSPSAPNVGFL